MPQVSGLSQPHNPSRRRRTTTADQKRRQSLDVGNDPLLSLNLNLDALAQQQAADRAQELFVRISALHDERYYAVAPDTVSFNSVLKACQSDPNRALEFWNSQMDNVDVNVRSYNTILLAFARAGLYRESLKVLEQMKVSGVLPNTITYNTCLLACATHGSGEAAEEADRLVREVLAAEDMKPDAITFNTLIDAWARHASPDAPHKAQSWLDSMQNYGVQPDVYSYTTVIEALASRGETDRAQEVLQSMSTAGLSPNRITYTSLIRALCRKQRFDDAHRTLKDMILQGENDNSVKPDAVSFAVLIDGWSRVATDRPGEAVTAVMELLKQMREYSLEWQPAAPSDRTYTSVLSTIARAARPGGHDDALNLLREMRSDGVDYSIIHVNAVLNAIAKCSRAEKTLLASDVFREIGREGLAPDDITYNTMLACSANSFGPASLKKKSLAIAMEIFQRYYRDPHHQTSSLTYHYVLRSVQKLCVDTNLRTKLTKQVGRLCCQEGSLNDRILGQLRKSLSTDDVLDLLGHADGDIASLPSQWSHRERRNE